MPHNVNYITGNSQIKDHWVKRGIAFIIDLVIIVVINILLDIVLFYLFFVTIMETASSGDPMSMTALMGTYFLISLLISLLFLAISILYFVLMEAKLGGTIGKKILKLRVVAIDDKMGVSKAFMRNLSKIGGILIGVFLGWLFMIVFIILFVLLDVYFGTGETPDPRQKYTDKMAGTTVIRTDIQENIEDLKYITTPGAMPSQEPKPESTPSAISDYTLESTGLSDETKTLETKTSVTGADSRTGEGEKLPEAQDEVVKKYSEFFEIDEGRALALYKAGYKRLEDFKDAIVDDLIMVEKINPTIGRRIIKKISSEPTKED